MNSDAGYAILGIVMWVITSVVATKIWTNKGGSGVVGFLLGFLLGWIGVLIAAVAKPSKASAQFTPGPQGIAPVQARECPFCKVPMRRDASVCLNCKRESTPWRFHGGFWWAKDTEGRDVYLDERANEWKAFQASAPPPSVPN
jgi:hypothetical protein